MNKHIALIGLCLAFSVMIGVAFVTASMGNVVEVDVWIWPQQLTIDGCDHHNLVGFNEWVIASILLPRDYSTQDVDFTSITLQVNGGSVPVSHYYTIWGRIIIAEFDRAEIVDLLRASIGHMTPYHEQKVTLVIIGDLRDGKVFRGEDTITAFFMDN